MRKKLFLIIISLCAILSLAACGAKDNAPPPEDTSGIAGDVGVPDPIDRSAGPEVSTENPAPVTSETQSTPTATETESTTKSTPANSTAGTTSKPNDTPSPGTPSQSTQSPSQTTSVPSSSQPPQNTTPTYTQKDYEDICTEIRAYAESIKTVKFMWKDAFVINGDDNGYYGHPDLTSLSKATVIGDLKFHVGLIEKMAIRENSPTVDFFVTWKEIDGAIHFFVLYG